MPRTVRVVTLVALWAMALLAIPHHIDILTVWTMDWYIGHRVLLCGQCQMGYSTSMSTHLEHHHRALAESRPDAFLPDLAASFNNLAAILSELGQHEAARDSTEKAVALYRSLAKAHPEAFRPGLALSLNNLTAILSELRQHEAARVTAEETIDLYRSLAETRPEAFRPKLAVSLQNLAVKLGDLGRPEEALATIEEALTVLSPYFLSQPSRYSDQMAATIEYYQGLSQELNHASNTALLEPIKALFESIGIQVELGRVGTSESLPTNY